MDIEPIGNQSFSIYISGDELSSRYLSPATVTGDDVIAMVSSILGAERIKNSSVEVFPGKSDILVFVRRVYGESDFFRFLSFEDVITAATSCDSVLPGELYFYEDVYILVLCRCSGSNENEFLCEFGERFRPPGIFHQHLREHGKLLLDGQILSRLRTIFSCNEQDAK